MAILTIDAGNTRVKWGLFDESGNLLTQGVSLHAELAMLQLPVGEQVVISNVAGNAIELALKKLLINHHKITWLTAQAQTCGVTNSYEIPSQLGTDRWATIIAAAHLHKQSSDLAPCIVVNAGTAVTIDVITFSEKLNDLPVKANKLNVNLQAHFAGGIILPGLNLMQQCLLQNTANLDRKSKLVANQYDNQAIANNTKDAIYLGAIHAICGAIYNIANQYQNNQLSPDIILSGGDAIVIKNSLTGDMTKQVHIVDNLVLQGLYLQSVNLQAFI